ncbi:MAG: type II toxin-antitoxin system VapC family toxin [Bacteroidota bacterium]
MKVLWDTHAVIWYIIGNDKLPESLREQIESPLYTNYVSVATYWEISIKSSLSRLKFEYPLEQIFEIISESGFLTLEISLSHLLRSTTLAFYHKDPFDRLLIGQALEENMTIVSKDRQFTQYEGLNILWG